MSALIIPGNYVRLPEQPDWGIGQVQSVVGNRITVNFEHAGKQLINTTFATLEPVDEGELGNSGH
jgi:transcription elongation factor GreA-like protein